jgi:hypothetical protein
MPAFPQTTKRPDHLGVLARLAGFLKAFTDPLLSKPVHSQFYLLMKARSSLPAIVPLTTGRTLPLCGFAKKVDHPGIRTGSGSDRVATELRSYR